MRIHHLNCGSMCPWGGHSMDGFSYGIHSLLVCHCLLIETSSGLVLVDTGLGEQDLENPRKRISSFFRSLNRIQVDPEKAAVLQIRQLGFQPEDVRHIILTHLDFDHAGGLSDFPWAEVHIFLPELEAARKPENWLDRQRFRKEQWSHVRNWQTYNTKGEPWFGFEAVRDLRGLPPEILMIPLVGHTAGHCGIAVDTGEGWLLHAGDAYFYRREMSPRYQCTTGLRLYQRMMESDRESRLRNQLKLRRLIQSRPADIRIFCAHDAVEFEAFRRAEIKNRRLLRLPSSESGFEIQ